MKQAVSVLPRAERVIPTIEALQRLNYELKSSEDLGEPFRDYLNEVQIHLSSLSNTVSDNWFAFDRGATA
jgi:hypothetical protein